MKRLRWSQDANMDIIAIAQFFADKNPYAGRRMLSRIDATAAAIAFMDTGREGRTPGTREKRVFRTPYVLAYALSETDPDELIILRVLHGAQEWTSMRWPDKN